MTIPSVALLGFLIPVLAIIGQGIGPLPAIVALFLYAQLPIIRNTYTAIRSVDPAIIEAAVGIGMTPRQVLWRIQVPLALPVIFAGVRNAVVLNVGVGSIAALIGAGGLGVFIFRGIARTYSQMIYTGALFVSLLALLADFCLFRLQKRLVSRGLR
ncbi:MAG: osmoprotectant transport system permease protein [Bacillota bacterium]|nr:ABC transporter permease [Bacillota bacterium]MDK2931457.1 osmoprotectant transport system permease protein [Bacillota bacterium]